VREPLSRPFGTTRHRHRGGINISPRQPAIRHLDPRGLTRADVRAMFEAAERYVRREGRAVILFWDEIDKSIAGRGPYLGEMIQELSTQLSGLNGRRTGVLMIAATNLPEKIPADIKGRRLKELKFGLPDRHGVAALLEGYVAKFPQQGGIDYRSATYLVDPLVVPARIEAWVQEMWRRAVRSARRGGRENPIITRQILTDVLLREHLGQPDGRRFTPEEERQIALHEICHAVVGKKLDQRVPVISMRSSFAQLAHATLSAPGNLLTERDFLAQIAALQAGYVAKRVLGVNLMGYGNDLYTAGSHATEIVERYALPANFEGFAISGLSWGRESTQRSVGATLKVSQRLAEQSEAAVRRICKTQLSRAERILRRFGVERLRWLAEKLREEKVILEEELDRLIAESERRFPHSHSARRGKGIKA
jgi:ATP-dependent Zn protease